MEDAIKSKFGIVWPGHVKNLTQFLIVARQAFDGDLDMFLVLAVIGDRTFSARNADPTMSYESWRRHGAPATKAENINMRSIAAYCGVPRETVRRKLAILTKKGWVERGEDGNIRATAKARRDLQPLTDASIQYVARMFALMDRARQHNGS